MRLGFEWIALVSVLRTPALPTDSQGFPQTAKFVQEPTGQEGGCSATQQFNPEPDKVYLVNYTSAYVDMDCSVAIFLETPTGKGTFKLESVGGPYVERPVLP